MSEMLPVVFCGHKMHLITQVLPVTMQECDLHHYFKVIHIFFTLFITLLHVTFVTFTLLFVTFFAVAILFFLYIQYLYQS